MLLLLRTGNRHLKCLTISGWHLERWPCPFLHSRKGTVIPSFLPDICLPCCPRIWVTETPQILPWLQYSSSEKVLPNAWPETFITQSKPIFLRPSYQSIPDTENKLLFSLCIVYYMFGKHYPTSFTAFQLLKVQMKDNDFTFCIATLLKF